MRNACAVGLVNLLLLCAPEVSAEVSTHPAPRLVLVVAVDQLGRGRLDPSLPGGIGRLTREGRVFVDAALDHAQTETCPGHVTMLTGRHPGPSGVPSNYRIDREAGAPRYCVADSSEDARVIGAEGGRSPRSMRVSTLGDWMKAAHPKTRVFAVSGKDRAAITLGGRGADAAYWLNRDGEPGFTTSRYYREALPEWVTAWVGDDPAKTGFLSQVPESWVHPGRVAGSPRPDDYPEESERWGRTSGHRVRARISKEFLDNLYHSPFLDTVTLDFARELVTRENLGGGEVPDLLAIGLSATDLIGHAWGPESAEAADGLRRTDVALGRFLDFLNDRLGEGRVLTVLTADHGVLPLPGWLTEQGRSRCPVPGGRAPEDGLEASLSAAIDRILDRDAQAPRPWTFHSRRQITVDRELAAELGVPAEKLVEAAKQALESLPGIARAWTHAEMQNDPSPEAKLFLHSYDPERSGDLILALEPTCLLTGYTTGTTHGTHHPYDRDVPLVFHGRGIAPGRVEGRAATVDIAPTLARLLGLAVPDGLDGRALIEP